ncbi:g11218 [Coccomyxa elongata]
MMANDRQEISPQISGHPLPSSSSVQQPLQRPSKRHLPGHRPQVSDLREFSVKTAKYFKKQRLLDILPEGVPRCREVPNMDISLRASLSQLKSIQPTSPRALTR